MKAYIFQAALLCSSCAHAVMTQTPPPEGVDPTGPDESLYDSSDWPKGPYAHGGGEADSPQHCDQCETFLENPLTEDGSAYVKAIWREHMDSGRGRIEILHQWRDYYQDEWREFCQEVEALPFGEVAPRKARRFYELTGE